jgi:hypothetical protein
MMVEETDNQGDLHYLKLEESGKFVSENKEDSNFEEPIISLHCIWEADFGVWKQYFNLRKRTRN